MKNADKTVKGSKNFVVYVMIAICIVCFIGLACGGDIRPHTNIKDGYTTIYVPTSTTNSGYQSYYVKDYTVENNVITFTTEDGLTITSTDYTIAK